MRLREFVQLNPAMLEAAIVEVVTGIEVGPKGEDSGFVCGPDNPIAALSARVFQTAAKRLAEYGEIVGPQVAIDHVLQFSFRIGAAYGRRVPDLTEPNLEAPMPTKERAANIAAMLYRECPPEVLREICLEMALLLREKAEAKDDSATAE